MLSSLAEFAVRVAAQIDPDPRMLVQAGYNQPLEGRGPIAAYAYLYWNQPGYPWTNTTLRAAIAPTYVDAELGFGDLLGRGTSIGLGLAGGGFADSYYDLEQGNLVKGESFFGAGAEASASFYHTFNPTPPGKRPDRLSEVPVQFVLRNSLRGSFYSPNNDTAPDFDVPATLPTYDLRTGIRWGGREPELFADAFEISAWYELIVRPRAQTYGFDNDLRLQAASQLFWGRLIFARMFPNRAHFELSVTGGGSVTPDRFTAFRLGGSLPMGSEFPLVVPGYYYQEISAQRFALVSGQLLWPLTRDGRWEIGVLGAAARVHYLEGMSLGEPWNSGLGGGIAYHSPAGAWHFLLGYGYGFNAIRNGDRGANAIGLLVQYDFRKDQGAFQTLWRNLSPSNWRGITR
ncbi:MAG: hypothetical protein KIT22_02595 [Verrucomicrobiae bacterium]|nr:hypothetical protein [Verrucomicrobiae bacterium]